MIRPCTTDGKGVELLLKAISANKDYLIDRLEEIKQDCPQLDPNALCNNQLTALSFATTRSARPELITKLLNLGANPLVKIDETTIIENVLSSQSQKYVHMFCTYLSEHDMIRLVEPRLLQECEDFLGVKFERNINPEDNISEGVDLQHAGEIPGSHEYLG